VCEIAAAQGAISNRKVNPMSDTPRTDEEVEIAKKYPATNHGLWVSAEFARMLERELSEAQAKLAADGWCKQCGVYHDPELGEICHRTRSS
jgi:hypothetical protein